MPIPNTTSTSPSSGSVHNVSVNQDINSPAYVALFNTLLNKEFED